MLICDAKQLKKLAAIGSSLKTIKNVIYFEDNETAIDSSISMNIDSWKVTSFSEVEKVGKSSPIQPILPIKKDIAVIMYTSGSTGMPKVWCNLLSIFPSDMIFNFKLECKRKHNQICSPFLTGIEYLCFSLARSFVLFNCYKT